MEGEKEEYVITNYLNINMPNYLYVYLWCLYLWLRRDGISDQSPSAPMLAITGCRAHKPSEKCGREENKQLPLVPPGKEEEDEEEIHFSSLR